MTTRAAILLLLLCLSRVAWAHQVSDSYLILRIDGKTLSGEWALALHDLEIAVGLDANGDGDITWGELKRQRGAVIDYAASRLDLELDGERMRVRLNEALMVNRLSNGTYAVLRFSLEGQREPTTVTVDYRAFFDVNRLHRGLVRLDHRGQTQQGIFSPVETRLRFDLLTPRPGKEFGRFVADGVWHIWTGFDHLLFLLALLLPAVLRRENGHWLGLDGFRTVFVNVVKVVTAFTVAHSVTLSLAVLNIVRLPARVVEPAIAASVVVAALNNLYPVVTAKTWVVAFAFGLLHGFGFASVLVDLGLPTGALTRALLGFNVGVELGQLAVVGTFLPLAYAIRHATFYRGVVLKFGSALTALVAAWWMAQRLAGG